MRRRVRAGMTGTVALLALSLCGVGSASAFRHSGAASAARHPDGASPAGHKVTQLAYRAIGTIAIEWKGSPADGCSAAGVCGVKGAITLRAGGGELYPANRNPPIVFMETAVARASVPGATPGSDASCASPESIGLFLRLDRDPSGSAEATVDRKESVDPPSAGACAGPTAGDLAALALPVRLLAHGGGLNLSGGDAFAAGPFAIDVHAHLRAFLVKATFTTTSTSGSVGSHHHVAHALEETASVTYRIVGQSGSLGGDFTGASGACASFGTCGDTGSLELSPEADGDTITISGVRTVDRPVSRRQALSDLVAGRLLTSGGFGALHLGESLTGTLMPPGAAMCTSTVSQPAPGFLSTVAGQTDTVFLVSSVGIDPFSFGDPLRSRCPGPLSADVSPKGVLARTSLDLSELAEPDFTVQLRAPRHRWRGDGYAGAFGGTLSFTLQQVRATGGTRRVRLATVTRRRGS